MALLVDNLAGLLYFRENDPASGVFIRSCFDGTKVSLARTHGQTKYISKMEPLLGKQAIRWVARDRIAPAANHPIFSCPSGSLRRSDCRSRRSIVFASMWYGLQNSLPACRKWTADRNEEACSRSVACHAVRGSCIGSKLVQRVCNRALSVLSDRDRAPTNIRELFIQHPRQSRRFSPNNCSSSS